MLRKTPLPASNLSETSIINNNNNTGHLPSSPATPSFSSATSTSQSHIPASLLDPTKPFPKLIVFDLDYTLWPFWVDTHVVPPLKVNAAHSAATDRAGENFAFFGDVPSILMVLPYLNGSSPSSSSTRNSTAKIKLGVASRTSAPGIAKELLKGLHLDPPSSTTDDSSSSNTIASKRSSKKKPAIDVFDGGMEIYPGSKIKHFEALGKRTGIAYADMLFFDDESRNRETERLGLTMRLVADGVTWEEVGKGVEEWRRRRLLRQG